MSRSPLFSLLHRAALAAQAARHAREPVDEFIEISRRRFLTAAGGAATALTLPACGLQPIAPDSGASVVVIGAGIAGLVATHRLRQAGIRVRLYEAQERVGGRMLSLRDYFPDGQVVELGAELIDTPHVRIRALAQELGLVLDDLAQDDPSLRAQVWHFRGRAHKEEEIIRAFMPVAEAIERDVAGLGTADVTYRTPGKAQRLDRMSIAEWLRRNRVSGWLGSMIRLAYTTEMGLESDEQSALNLLTRVGTRSDEFRIYGRSDGRYRVRGGSDLLAKALADRVAGAIELGSVLEAIGQSADGTYRLAIRQASGTREVSATHVVLALPVTILREVSLNVPLPPEKQRAIRELRYGTNAKLVVGFDERIWRTRHASNGSVHADLPFQATWEATRLQPGKGGVLTNFTGGRHGVEIGEGTPAKQANKLAEELDVVFPGVLHAREGAKEARLHWPSSRWARGSYVCLAPGQWTTLRGAIGESVGNLHFAGEHCSLASPGFMEGGCETGEAAAAAILRGLGREMPSAAAPGGVDLRRDQRFAV